jgi:hypothetical protein
MSERIIEDLAIFLPGSKVKELLQARLEVKQQSRAFYTKQRDEFNEEIVRPEDESLVRDKSIRIAEMIKTVENHIRLYEFWLKWLDIEATYKVTPERHHGALALLGINFDSYNL